MPEEAKSFIRALMNVDPEKRLDCHRALAHDWFREQASKRRKDGDGNAVAM